MRLDARRHAEKNIETVDGLEGGDMLTSFILVGIGGFLGANARFIVSNWIKKKCSSSFPVATFVVNSVGSFLLGLFIGLHVSNNLQLLLGTGFLGAFTTFSTFQLESVQLAAEMKKKLSIIYLASSYTIGLLLAFLAYKLGILF